MYDELDKTRQAEQASETDFSRSDSASSLRGVAELLLFYFGLPSITLFPVGAIVLWFSLVFHYKHNFFEAWYAVSLVSPMLAISIGATTLLTPITLIKVAWPLLIVFLFLTKRELVWSHGWKRNLGRRLVTLGIISFLFYVLGPLSALVDLSTLTVATIAGNEPLIWGGMLLIVVILALLLGYGGALFAGYLLARDYNRCRSTRSFRSRNWPLRGLLVAYAANIVFAVGLWGTRPPPLPTVEYGDNLEDGQLLGVTAGYWHIVDEEGNVVAVPNDEAGSVILEPKFE